MAAQCGAAGCLTNHFSLAAYDAAGLDYASDMRGETPFRPALDDKIFNTPQIPATLPTLDELLGHPEYLEAHLTDHYPGLLRRDRASVLTIHAELEGMSHAYLVKKISRTAACTESSPY